MPEYHAIVSVQAHDVERADAVFERIQRDALRLGGRLTVIPSAVGSVRFEPDATVYEPHPHLEREFSDACTCGGSGAMDGHAYTCKLRRVVK